MDEDLVIDARGLYHIYRGRELETVALRGADLALEPGSWTSVMGPSGSGKSTLLHVMAGLLEPSGGAVMIGADDITRLPAPERAQRRRRLIGVVLQRDNLHPLLDVAGNVALPLRLDGVRPDRARAEAVQRLAQVGVDGLAHQRADRLSMGQQQLVAIARAIAGDRRLLLADEPTAALDTVTAEQVVELLAALASQLGIGVLMVTHDSRLASWADRVLVLRDGRVLDEVASSSRPGTSGMVDMPGLPGAVDR